MTFRFFHRARRASHRRDPDQLIKAFWRTLERLAQHERADREPSGSPTSAE
ncbi:MAG: hypothetical protein H6872_08270 [Methylobacteriaceae bacterium]|nr:hypothetical protein [Methylobacteriaceae bacterium]